MFGKALNARQGNHFEVRTADEQSMFVVKDTSDYENTVRMPEGSSSIYQNYFQCPGDVCDKEAAQYRQNLVTTDRHNYIVYAVYVPKTEKKLSYYQLCYSC